MSLHQIVDVTRHPAPQFLSTEVLKATVPAAFATKPDERVSASYRFVPTFDIVTKLGEYGYLPVSAVNPVRKANGKTGPLVPSLVGAHMITFEPEVPVFNKEGRLQVVLINAHNRTKRFRLAAGFLRFVCSNGLISGSGDLQIRATHTVSHTAHLDDDIEATLSHATRLTSLVDVMQKTILTTRAANTFAKEAMALRFGPERLWRITPKQVLEARRDEDQGDDVWRVFNRVQENLVKGGIRNDNTPMATFPLTRPRQTFNFNSKLWELAESKLPE